MRAVTLILIAALAGVSYYLLPPEGHHLIDRVRINMTRAHYHFRYYAGLPLPGTPDLNRIDERLAAQGAKLGVPVYLRIFKLEHELELWVEKDGRFVRFDTYPICVWSGQLGPKLKERDNQAPEGFYTVSTKQLNPKSRWHRSFNLGYPNSFDQAHGRTGSFLMVHGGCGSIGCYAVTDPVVDELWRLVKGALDKGEKRIPVHVFPFRMTESNISLRRGYKWESFWADLKKGYDMFEQARVPPLVSVCKGRYVFAPGNMESFAAEVKERCPPELAGRH